MERTCLAQSLHTFRVFILFFQFQSPIYNSYVISVTFFKKKNAFYLKYIWVKRIKSSYCFDLYNYLVLLG